MSTICRMIAKKASPFFTVRQQLALSAFAALPTAKQLSIPGLNILLLFPYSPQATTPIWDATASFSTTFVTAVITQTGATRTLCIGDYVVGEQNDFELYGHPKIRY